MTVRELAKDKRERENKELIRRYQETGDESYKDEFFRHNMNLTWSVAHNFKNVPVALDELQAVAIMGMLKAFSTFKLEKEVKVSTYFITCMRNEILMYLRNGRKHMNHTTVNLEHVLNADEDGNELTLMDVTADPLTSREMDSRVEQYGIDDLLHTLKAELTDIEWLLLENDMEDEPMTQYELGEMLGLSQSYISRIQNRARRKARKKAVQLDNIGNDDYNGTGIYKLPKKTNKRGTIK